MDNISDIQKPADLYRQSTIHDIQAGQLLRLYRKKRKISQSQLADHAGVSFQQYQKYEKGQNRISIGRLFLLCDGLKIKPSRFIGKLEKLSKSNTLDQ